MQSLHSIVETLIGWAGADIAAIETDAPGEYDSPDSFAQWSLKKSKISNQAKALSKLKLLTANGVALSPDQLAVLSKASGRYLCKAPANTPAAELPNAGTYYERRAVMRTKINARDLPALAALDAIRPVANLARSMMPVAKSSAPAPAKAKRASSDRIDVFGRAATSSYSKSVKQAVVIDPPKFTEAEQIAATRWDESRDLQRSYPKREDWLAVFKG